MRAGGVVLLWLLSTSVAHAAPGPARPGSQTVCDSHSTTLKKLLRHKRSFGGPLAPTRTLLGAADLTARMNRGTGTGVDDDDAAIQNDAPAASIDVDERAVPALQPLGILVNSCDRRLYSRAFSPRSPRGPPSHS